MFELLLQQTANGLALGMAYALVALGLTLIFGVLHVINFVHGDLYMVGGLVTTLVTGALGGPYLAALPAAIVIVALLAWLIDRAAVRPILDKPDGASIALLSTFAISLLLHQGVLASWGTQPARVDGVPGVQVFGPVAVTNQRLLLLGSGLLLLLGLELALRCTHFGKTLRAVAQNPFAARVVGIDVQRVRSVTYVGAAALAGLAGALLTPIVLFAPSMGQHIVISAFVIVVVGGMGNISGAVTCGLGLGVLEALLSTVMPQEIGSTAIYALLLVTLLIRPQGLFARG
ncbi:branched-chain amino acid ABC transporter permease [Azospirillum endophyticum]